jgi:hypothetical protein
MGSPRPVVPPGGATFTLDFHGRPPSGTLELIEGGGAFDYVLPGDGLGSPSLGAGSAQRRTFFLRNPDRVGRSVLVLFWPSTAIDPAPGGSPFATLEVRAWLPEEQVVRIRSLIPAQIEVEADRAEWLESPKFWIPGYRARVDGTPAPVLRSAGGLVAVAVPEGLHRVELSYGGPWPLYAAYFLSLATWLGAAIAGVRGWVRRQRGLDGNGAAEAGAV